MKHHLGVIAAMMTGLAHGTLWGIGTIYGLKSGLSIEQVSIFMFTFIIGGALNQYLIGYLSDTYDRRTIIVIVAFLAGIFSILALIFGNTFFSSRSNYFHIWRSDCASLCTFDRAYK